MFIGKRRKWFNEDKHRMSVPSAAKYKISDKLTKSGKNKGMGI